MTTSHESTRRDFVKKAALGSVALGAAASANVTLAAETRKPKRKSNIRIGVRFKGDWLKSANDRDLQFFKQIGVDYVDIELRLIKGYEETGTFKKEDLDAFISRLDAVGLKIERANSLGPHYLNAHLNRPEGQKEIDKLKRIGDMVAEAEIPVFGIQACQAALHIQDFQGNWIHERGRGGYRVLTFDIDRAEARYPKPKYTVKADDLWKGVLNIYRQVMPTVEGSKTVIAMHGNDPPMYRYLGNPQILCRFADFDRLFEEVPSKHNGITFCVGTRFESGEDIYKGLSHFGEQGRLFHVHFRNVRGTLPSDRGYSEVMVDDGDIDMPRVVKILDEVGYQGVIDYDHPMQITGDQPLPKQYVAFAVGYQRALLQNLTSGDA